MALFLDSADLDDIAYVEAMAVIRGITMNLTLLRPHTDDPLKHLSAVLEASSGEAMYQPTKADHNALNEALRAYELDPERVVAKVPVTRANLPVAAESVRRGVPVALTEALALGHMLICEKIGAGYRIPYVDRAARDPRASSHLVRELASIQRGAVTIVAASLKSAAQVLEARVEGADIISSPATVINSPINHPMSEEAAHDFDKKYSRGNSSWRQ